MKLFVDDSVIVCLEEYKDIHFDIPKEYTCSKSKFIPPRVWLVKQYLYEKPFLEGYINTSGEVIRLTRAAIDWEIAQFMKRQGYRMWVCYLMFWYLRLTQRKSFWSVLKGL